MNTLIFNADDYGLSLYVSAGILEAAAGVVLSTTVMGNLATAEELRALQCSPLNAGAHLNLSCGRPLDPAYPSELLNAAGEFDKQLALDPATWERPAWRDAAVAEWRWQVERLARAGIELTHLDSHHHTHLLAPLFPLALTLARELRLPLRTATEQQRTEARTAGVCTPGCLVVGFFGKDSISREHLLSEIAAATSQTVEVMCHPGRIDDRALSRTGYTMEREQELAVLSDPGLAAELEDLGWRLAGYGELRGS